MRLGGRPGERLIKRIGMQTSNDTILRCLKRRLSAVRMPDIGGEFRFRIERAHQDVIIEDIHCASVYIDIISGAGSFNDPAWIERRHKEALARLDEETDETFLPGLRAVAAVWFEEKAYMRMRQRARALAEAWDWEGAKALWEGFAAWMTARAGVPWEMPEDRWFPWGGMAYLRRIDPEEWRRAGEA